MRNFLLSFLFLIPLFFASCDKDESDPPLHIGTWELSKIEVGEIIVNPLEMKTLIEQYLNSIDIEGVSGTMTFDKNGNYTGLDGNGEVTNAKYTVKGDVLSIDGEEPCKIGFEGKNKLIVYLDITNEINEEAASMLPDNVTITKIVIKITNVRK